MNKKIRFISIIAMVISILGVGITYGLYRENSNKIENTFIKVKDTNIIVNETFNGTVKENVSFDIKSDVPTYLKVRLVFNFKDDEGNIMSFKPIEGIDYNLEINDVWKYKNGYYYLDYPITSIRTPVLIKHLNAINTNYKLAVEILAQTANELS